MTSGASGSSESILHWGEYTKYPEGTDFIELFFDDVLLSFISLVCTH